MDWLQRMNRTVEYIEENLTDDIQLEALARINYCSAYEFSRIFTFIAGMSVSDYIRRRRLSQAVFDIQNGSESILYIALKYRYESQSAFTRAFRELHGQTPASARRNGISLKTYPKITFKLIIKGVTEMEFRIEKLDSFKLTGRISSIDFSHWQDFNKNQIPRLQAMNFFKAPFWLTGAYFLNRESDESVLIGAELRDEPIPEGYSVETIPASLWAVFPCCRDIGPDACGETYAKIVAEWLPLSNYRRNEAVPYLEVYADISDTVPENYLEVWVPVLAK